MAVPLETSNFPTTLDTDTNLYVVHDSLRVQLAEDYNPGSTTITVTGSTTYFPPTGIITLTEQCSETDLRATSYFYSGVTTNTFTGLEILPEFIDVYKPAVYTNVTMNVMAQHKNIINNALIAIENFVGKLGDTSLIPLSGTMVGRLNFLRNLVYKPKAWFSISSQIGVIPFTVSLTDQSFRNPNTVIIDWGDSSTTSITPTSTVSHTYYSPGKYDITLTATNSFGVNVLTVPSYITARLPAPNPATLLFNPASSQIYASGVLTSPANTTINVLVQSNGAYPADPVIDYVWQFNDDLTHANSSQTQAQYSIGGIYTVILDCITQLGAYRITEFNNVINVIENTNLFLFIFPDPTMQVTKNVSSYEFGLISETFKITGRTSRSITRNYNLVTGTQQQREFLRNNGFTPRSLQSSGNQGQSIVYWSSDNNTSVIPNNVEVSFLTYTGFTDSWSVSSGVTQITRGWNWLSLNTSSSIYLLFGENPNITGTSPTNQTVDYLNLSSLTANSFNLTSANYANGADELISNTCTNFSVYRSTWSITNGFFLRNYNCGVYFRLLNFYRTEPSTVSQIDIIRKLNDLPGLPLVESEIVSLNNGIYVFTNSGNVSMWNNTQNTWFTMSPVGNNFSALQDSSVSGYDSLSQTFVATSDGNNQAYLSFDYSTKTFIKFNNASLTFSGLSNRPTGEQWGTFTM